jgi:hypothetical protein
MQIPSRRLLFCDTSEGKGSIVRALEADLHCDAALGTIEQLHRFIPRLGYIDTERTRNAASGSSQAQHGTFHKNVKVFSSLSDALQHS